MKPSTLRLSRTAVALCATAALLAACGGSSDGGSKSDGGDSEYVDGGTFTMSMAGDPGKLDPQSSASTQLFTVNQIAYDNLVSVDGKTGEIESQLATDWKVDGKTVTLTLGKGITCSDGSDFTATTAADNINYVGDPKNKSPYLGTFLPAGATAKADDTAGTVTITLAAACAVRPQRARQPADGLRRRHEGPQHAVRRHQRHRSLRAHRGRPRATTTRYKIREGYTWGPDGATTAEKGMPDTIVMKIVQNEGTSANLLLSGEINAATIQGPDAKRLDAAKLFSTSTPAMVGEQWYNHNDGHETSDAAVRMALTQAIDFGELASVATAGTGGPATTFAAIEPVSCPGDSISPSLPAQDVDAAKSVLAGKKLTFIYSSAAGSAVAAAAELAVQEWKAAGADVTAKGVDETALQGAIFGSGDWDIAWVPLNVNSPDQLVPFLSGPGLADGGTNFSGIDNQDYTDGVTAASAMNGTDGCDTWLDAESKLVAAADIVPFANNAVKTYGNGAEFEYPGTFAPTTIRMLAK